MADFQPIGQPVPANAVPIAGKDNTGKLAYLTLDASGNLNVNTGGASGTAVTIADGADVTEGAIADAKVVGDNSGTVSAKLRGLNYLLNLVTDTVNSWLKVSIQNASLVVAGDVANDSGDSGNPIKVGFKALSTAPTAVTANDRVNAMGDLWGRLHTRTGAQPPSASTWAVTHVPASATQATITQASAGGAIRNVCTGFTVTFAAGSTAPAAATPITVAVIDGASGGTTYLWRTNICVPATANAIVSFIKSDIWLPGTAATAMTIEFSAAGGANTYQSVTMNGVKVED